MKTIKVLTLFLFALISFACINEESETVKINILPTLEINQDDYTPLKSADSENSFVYAVQIYEGEAPIYYGLFDDISKMEIVLTTNMKYTLKVAAYQRGTGLGLKTLTQIDFTKYYLPDTVSLLNKFVLGDRLVGISDVSNAKLIYNKYSKYPEIDVFYQETEVSVIKGMSSIDIPLKRTGFGLGINVDGLTTGKIEVYLDGDTILFTPLNKSYFTIRSFTGGTNGLADVAKVDTYFVNSNIGVKWIGNNGSVFTASKTVKLKRNFQLPLNININSTSTGIIFESWQNDISDSIISIYPPSPGLVAWYPFNGNANDESGNGNYGVVYGAKIAEDRFGNQNKAYKFDGLNDFIEILPDSLYTQFYDFTLSVWIKNTGWQNQSIGDSQYIFDGHGSEKDEMYGCFKQGFLSYINNNSLGQTVHTGVMYKDNNFSLTYDNTISTTQLTNNWHHIVFSRKADRLSTYFDKVLINNSSGYSLDQILDMNHPWYIGTFCGNNPYYLVGGLHFNYSFKGYIDEVGIWNRALTQQEIEGLFNVK